MSKYWVSPVDPPKFVLGIHLGYLGISLILEVKGF